MLGSLASRAGFRSASALSSRSIPAQARSFCNVASREYETILVETRGKVALVTLNRPKALNALCTPLLNDVRDAFKRIDEDSNLGAIVVTGSNKAFAAGADIKEMSELSFMDCYKTDMFEPWQEVAATSKPVIAAVNGYALGGGCEFAMICDFIIAGDKAQFGQPEITLGTIPGIGGGQRLARAVGKAKAMDMVLTGRMIGAQEALDCGLVSRVVPADDLVDEAVAAAEKIASYSQPIVKLAKQCVNTAFETTLAEGIKMERVAFHATFSSEDQKEGMAAFIEKRKPEFKNN